MTKATTLAEVIRYFNPMQPLRGDELKSWYIDRPGNPADKMEKYLQGLALNDMPVKILFTGHRGNGKSTELNKLSEKIKNQFIALGRRMKWAVGVWPKPLATGSRPACWTRRRWTRTSTP